MATRTVKKAAAASRIGAAVATTQDRLLDTVHQVWLAGIGAFAKAQRSAPQLFEDLVKEGARVHAATSKSAGKAVRSTVGRARAALEERADSARSKAADTLESLEKVFQARVQRTLHQMGVPGNRDISRLSARIDELNANIEKLARRRTSVARAGDGKRAAAVPLPAAH